MDLEKESKGLFDAWENYWKAIEFSFYQGKREGFECLEEFDKEFKKIIQPLILSFFERNPHIRRGRGYHEDLEIYREFTKPFRVPKRGEGYPGHVMISLDNYSFRHFLDGYYQGSPILPRVACIEKAEDVQKFYRKLSTQEDNGRGYLRSMWERYYNFFWSLIEREKTLQAILVPRTLKLATSQAGKGEREDTEIPVKVEQKVLLKLEVETRDTYWKGERQETLSEIPYKILYALAMRPGRTLKYKTLGDILTPIAIKERKVLSKHIQTITARIPPLRNYIENKEEVGYTLKLTEAEIEITGEIKEIDDLLT